MTEERQTYTKYICKRCKREIELPGGNWLGLRMPSGWKKINNTQLCTNCVKDYDQGYHDFFSKFMGKKKKSEGVK